MAKCKSCSAEIEFIEMEGGKKMPVDARPGAYWAPILGTTVIVQVSEHKAVVARPITEGDTLVRAWVPHWVSCPSAAEHRKRPTRVRGRGRQR